MGSSKASTIAMTIAAVLILLVAVTDARWGGGGGGKPSGGGGGKGGKGGGKHHRFGMDDCGRNRTCRELSRECKKMFFASMVDDYVDAGDDEIITTVEKMAAMMEMLMEHQQNLTDCANKTGIELPNSGGKNPFTRNGSGSPRLRDGRREGDGFRGDRLHPHLRGGRRESRDISFGRKRKGFGGGGKGHNGNFGVSEEEAVELKKCLLNKKGLLNSDDTLNREAYKTQISSAYDSQPDVQTAVEEAVDSCPEPEDYNIHGFIKCINKACIDNIELEDDEDSPQVKWGVLP